MFAHSTYISRNIKKAQVPEHRLDHNYLRTTTSWCCSGTKTRYESSWIYLVIFTATTQRHRAMKGRDDPVHRLHHKNPRSFLLWPHSEKETWIRAMQILLGFFLLLPISPTQITWKITAHILLNRLYHNILDSLLVVTQWHKNLDLQYRSYSLLFSVTPLK